MFVRLPRGTTPAVLALVSLCAAVEYEMVNIERNGLRIAFRDAAGDRTLPDFLAFSSRPDLDPAVRIRPAGRCGSAVEVSAEYAGRRGAEYFQWIAFSLRPCPGGSRSGTITVDYGAPCIDMRRTGRARIDNGVVHVPLLSALSKSRSVSPPSPPCESGLKMEVADDGIYVVKGSDLHRAGVPINRIPSRSYRLFLRDREIPLYIAGSHRNTLSESDELLFYGHMLRGRNHHYAHYSFTNVYWLTWNDGAPGIRVAEASGRLRLDGSRYRDREQRDVEPTARDFRDTVHIELDNGILWLGGIEQPRELRVTEDTDEDVDNWYWGTMGEKELTEFTFPLVSPAARGRARIRIGLMGITAMDDQDTDHMLTVLLNGESPGGSARTAAWDGQKAHVFTLPSVSNELLVHGKNELAFVTVNRGFADRSALNWIEIAYDRDLRALDNAIHFRNHSEDIDALKQFEIEGFTRPSLELWDIGGARFIEEFTVRHDETGGKETFTLVFQDSLSRVTRFYAQSTDKRRRPALMHLDTIRTDWDWGADVDYVMITPRRFEALLQPLAELHRSRGLRVQIVALEDIYNRFGYGLRDPESIRRMLRYVCERAGDTPPRYLLLAGDASHDFDKTAVGRSSNVVPTHLSRVSNWGPCSNDGYFAEIFGDDHIADLYTGRFPARDSADLQRMVRKTIRALSMKEPGFWRENLLLAGGREAVFTRFNNRVRAAYVGNALHIERIDADPASPYFTTRTGASRHLADMINTGVYAVNFNGHGGGNVWSDNRLFSYTDMGKLYNDQWGEGGRLPHVFSFTCLTGFFESTEYRSLGEEFLRSSEAGAVSFYGASGYTSRNGNIQMNALLLRDAVAGSLESIGELLWRAETHMLVLDRFNNLPLVRQYNLIGDPALPWRLPPDTLDLALSRTALGAGDTLTIKGKTGSIRTGKVKVRVMSGTEQIAGATTGFSRGRFKHDVVLKDSAVVTRGLVRAYAWNDSSEVRGWVPFAKDRIIMHNVTASLDTIHFGDSVRISGELSSPSGGALPAIRCLYAVASPFIGENEFEADGSVGITALDSTRWITSSPVPVRFQEADKTSLKIRFRSTGAFEMSEIYSFTVHPLCDLRVERDSVRVVFADDSLRAVFSVHNSGAAAAGPFGVRAVWGTAPDTVHAGGAVRKDSSGVGESVPFALALNDTQGVVPLAVYVNPARDPAEIDYANNRGHATLRVGRARLRDVTDTLFSPGGGVAVSPAARLSRRHTVFLFGTPPQRRTPRASGGAWVPLRGDSVAAFRIALRRKLRAGDSLRWSFEPARSWLETHGAEGTSKSRAEKPSAATPVLMSFDTLAGGWLPVRTGENADSSRLSLTTRSTGPFAAATIEDHEPPAIQVSVAGQPITFLDYAPRNKAFDISISDPSGVVAHSVEVALNGTLLDETGCSRPHEADTSGNVRLTAYPPKKRRIDSLSVRASDFAGNDTTAFFAYLPGEKLRISFLACHPNPFTDARNTGEGIRLAFLLTDMADEARLSIHTISGKRIRHWKFRDAIGYREVGWDGRSHHGYHLANGTYYLKLTARTGKREVKKLIRIAKLEGYRR